MPDPEEIPGGGTPPAAEPAAGDPPAVAPDVPPAPPAEPPAAEGDQVEKAGKKYSKATASAIKGLRKSISDATACMKAFDDLADDDDGDEDEDAGKADGAGDLAKMAGDLAKATAENELLKAEIIRLKGQPAASPIDQALQKQAVEKKDDSTVPPAPTTPEDDSPLGLIKKAQASPRAMF